MKKNAFAIIVFFLVAVGLVVYVIVGNRAKQGQDVKDTSEVEKLLKYDFQENYPKTVKETVRLHCRYMKCAYNNEFAEDDLQEVNEKVRNLYDDELLEYNREDEQFASFQQDVEYYGENKQKIVSYSYGEDSQIEYNTENDTEYAKMIVSVMLRLDSGASSVEEEYILRKNAQGQWKILGWKPVTKTDGEGDKK